jgi:hypothetical protein
MKQAGLLILIFGCILVNAAFALLKDEIREKLLKNVT